MFAPSGKPSRGGTAFGVAEVIFYDTVRHVRRSHANALVALLLNILQTVIFLAAFYVLMTFFGMTGFAIRGDFVLYLMSGVFMFMTHTKASGAVFKSEGPTSPMMHHRPMNTAVAIASAALSSLYIQVLSMSVVLYVYHAVWGPITIEDPVGAMGMLLMAWFSGVAVGSVFLALKPWFPDVAGILNTIWSRANMIASGKMFVANMLSFTMMSLFIWNPLFHIIDQTRGFVFLNYFPRYTSLTYPVYVSLGLLAVGLLGEFFTRRHASLSWNARR
jgi:ABC-type polysaccharide/polyol phosphate export permease